MKLTKKRTAHKTFNDRGALPMSSLVLEPLEPRLLLSADPLLAIASSDNAAMLDQQAEHRLVDNIFAIERLSANIASDVDSAGAVADLFPAPLDLQELAAVVHSAEDIHDNARQEVIFVDSAVDDYDSLLRSIESANSRTEFSVIVLNSDTDGVQQISAALAELSNVDAVHLIAHGDQGAIRLGNTDLNAGTLDNYLQEVASWRGALDIDADFLIYGCDVTSGFGRPNVCRAPCGFNGR